MKAKDIMTAKPESVTPGTNIADVWALPFQRSMRID